MLLVLELRRRHGEAGLAHGGRGAAWNQGQLGLDTGHHGGRGHGTLLLLLLLLLDPIIFNQLGMLFLLLTNLGEQN